MMFRLAGLSAYFGRRLYFILVMAGIVVLFSVIILRGESQSLSTEALSELSKGSCSDKTSREIKSLAERMLRSDRVRAANLYTDLSRCRGYVKDYDGAISALESAKAVFVELNDSEMVESVDTSISSIKLIKQASSGDIEVPDLQ